jgi:regulatory protein
MNLAAGSGEEGFKIALAKARQWCASEERCPLDIKLKLIKLECSPSDINRILEQISQEGFTNEQRYANAYASGKFRISKWGKIKIASGLRMKKIPERFITTALNGIDPQDYRECLQKLLKKKQKEFKNITSPQIKNKLARFALQKGYEREMVFNLLGTKEE